MFKINFDAEKPMRATEGILLGAFLGTVFWLAVFALVGWYA
jgi:hypothetical protein